MREEPRLFVPKLASTTISTAWVIGLLNSVGESTYLYYALALPFITLLGVFVSVMVAAMVDSGSGLREGFYRTIRRWKTLLGASGIFLVTGLVFSLPMSIGLMFYLVAGNLVALAIGSLVSISAILLFSFGVYFLPITIVKNRSIMESLKDSATTSRQNSREVSLLLLFSLALLGLASVSQGTLRGIGYLGFALGRLLSAMATTYLFVVSPNYYLSE